MTISDRTGGSAFFKRSLAALGATALSAGAMVPFAASASADGHVQDLQVACEGLTDSVGFQDIQSLHPATQDAINCLAQYGITQGRSDTVYAPRDAVKRYEMAIFLDRVLSYVDEFDTIGMEIPYDPSDAGFQDLQGVPEEGVDAINAIANLGIAQGKSAQAYDPFAPVNRRDMASFINRIQNEIAEHEAGAAYDPADATKEFDDVPTDLARAHDIYSLEGAGIVQGTSANTYKPYAPVLRSEMAFFIMRHLNENMAAGRVESQAGPDDTTGPSITAGGVTAGATTVTFTANEELDADSVVAADFAETSAADISGVSVGTDGRTITVTFGAALAAGDTVTLQAGSVTDAVGNAGPVANVAVTVSAAADQTGPGVTAGSVEAGATTVVFTANEELDADSVVAADFAETSAADISGVSVGTDGRTITVTFGAALAAGDTVTLQAGSVTDAAGNAGPASDVSVTAEDTTAPGVAVLAHPGSTTIHWTALTTHFSGTAEPGSTVEIRTADTKETVASDVANAEGAFYAEGVPLEANAANEFVVVVVDEAGNASAESDVYTVIHDDTAPGVTSSGAQAGSLTFTVTFSEPISQATLAAEDFTLATAAATNITDITFMTGTEATVTLDAALQANDQVTLAANAVADFATNTGPAAPVTITAS